MLPRDGRAGGRRARPGKDHSCSLRNARARGLSGPTRERKAYASCRQRGLPPRDAGAGVGRRHRRLRRGGRRVGCTVTSLASLSLTPPTLFICLARSSSTLAGLREAGAFSVNLLAARHESLAHHFSGRGGVQGPRRFEGAPWTTLATGAPILADATAAFDCLIEEMIERHSHAIVLGAVVEPARGRRGARAFPLAQRIRGRLAPAEDRTTGLNLRDDMKERAGDTIPP